MNDTTPATTCPGCGAPNHCAIANDEPIEQCWCMHADSQRALPNQADTSCFCPQCLQRLLHDAR